MRCKYCHDKSQNKTDTCDDCKQSLACGDPLPTFDNRTIHTRSGLGPSAWLESVYGSTLPTQEQVNTIKQGGTMSKVNGNGKPAASNGKANGKAERVNQPLIGHNYDYNGEDVTVSQVTKDGTKVRLADHFGWVPASSLKPTSNGKTRERANTSKPANTSPSKRQAKQESKPATFKDGNGGTSRSQAVEAETVTAPRRSRKVAPLSVDASLLARFDSALEAIATIRPLLAEDATPATITAQDVPDDVRAEIVRSWLDSHNLAALAALVEDVPVTSKATRKATRTERAATIQETASKVKRERASKPRGQGYGMFGDALIDALKRSRKPLTLSEAFEQADARGAFAECKGKTPDRSFTSQAYVMLNREDSPIVKTTNRQGQVAFTLA